MSIFLLIIVRFVQFRSVWFNFVSIFFSSQFCAVFIQLSLCWFKFDQFRIVFSIFLLDSFPWFVHFLFHFLEFSFHKLELETGIYLNLSENQWVTMNIITITVIILELFDSDSTGDFRKQPFNESIDFFFDIRINY